MKGWKGRAESRSWMLMAQRYGRKNRAKAERGKKEI